MKSYILYFAYICIFFGCKSSVSDVGGKGDSAYSACYKIDSTSADGLFHKGKCFYDYKNYTAAYDCFKESVLRGKDDFDVWYALGLAAFEIGNFEKAQVSFMKAEMYKSSENVKYNIALSAAQAQDYKAVIYYLSPFMTDIDNANYCEYLRLYVSALIEQDKLEDAEKWISFKNCTDDINRYLFYHLQDRKGNYNRIVSEMPVFETDEYQKKFSVTKGFAYFMLSDYLNAIKWASIDKENPTAKYTLGHSFLKLGYVDSACFYLNDYLNFTNDSTEIVEIMNVCKD